MPYWSPAPRCTQGEPKVPRVTEFVVCDYAIFRHFGDLEAGLRQPPAAHLPLARQSYIYVR